MKTFLKAILFIVLLLIPALGLAFYGFMGAFGCGLGGVHDFVCRVIVPGTNLLSLLAVVLSLVLGSSIAHGRKIKVLVIIYVVSILLAPVSFFTYSSLPPSIKQEVLEGKNEKNCSMLDGVSKDSCLLSVFRTRLASSKGDISWCEEIIDKSVKTRCLADVSSNQGNPTYCTQITDQYPASYHGQRGDATIDQIAMLEREKCYNRATFALKNTYINTNYGGYRYAYDEKKCSEEPRDIVKNYCYFRLDRCDLIADSTISKDCLLYRSLYIKNNQ